MGWSCNVQRKAAILSYAPLISCRAKRQTMSVSIVHIQYVGLPLKDSGTTRYL